MVRYQQRAKEEGCLRRRLLAKRIDCYSGSGMLKLGLDSEEYEDWNTCNCNCVSGGRGQEKKLLREYDWFPTRVEEQ
jgi:hypothetical protein